MTGIQKRQLVAVRHQKLSKGEDWTTDRNVVCYTPAGLEKLLAALGLSSAALAWPAPGEGQDSGVDDEAAAGAADGAGEAFSPPPTRAPSPQKSGAAHRALQRWPWPRSVAQAVAAAVDLIAAPVELTVLRIFPNPSLLEAEGADGVRVRVRVASNANFIRGMKLKARPSADAAKPWLLVGHCPRWRGRY